jgi:ABC-type Fe3+-siderophore transport system permease subunit
VEEVSDIRWLTLVVTALVGSLLVVMMWLLPLRETIGDGKLFGLIAFGAPFVTVYSIAHLMSPKLEEGRDIESGIMAGFRYRDREGKRWQILTAAGIAGALNVMLLVFSG